MKNKTSGDAMAKAVLTMFLLFCVVIAIAALSITAGLELVIGFAPIYKYLVGTSAFTISVIAIFLKFRFG